MELRTNSGIPPGCNFLYAGVPGVSLADSLNPRLPAGNPPGWLERKAPAPDQRGAPYVQAKFALMQ